MGYLLGTVFALGTLIVFAAVVFGVMVGAGALLHHFRPNRKFDEFAAFHKPIIVGLLIALAVLWIIPPHPWSKRPKRQPRAEAVATVQTKEG